MWHVLVQDCGMILFAKDVWQEADKSIDIFFTISACYDRNSDGSFNAGDAYASHHRSVAKRLTQRLKRFRTRLLHSVEGHSDIDA